MSLDWNDGLKNNEYLDSTGAVDRKNLTDFALFNMRDADAVDG